MRHIYKSSNGDGTTPALSLQSNDYDLFSQPICEALLESCLACTHLRHLFKPKIFGGRRASLI